MKRKINISIASTLVLLQALMCCSCAEEFLETRKDKSQMVPRTLDDVQLLLDNNVQVFGTTAGLPTIASDEFFTDRGVLSTLAVNERNSYTWAQDFYEGTISNLDWSVPYLQVFYANMALEVLKEIRETDGVSELRKDHLEGTALFHRSYAFFNLAQEFSENYLPSVNDGDPGIPLKLTGNIHEPLSRPDLKTTYERIVSDLVLAEQLLPEDVENLSRPSKVSARALLARVYLSMSDYPRALGCAERAIPELSLLDYSQIDTTSPTRNLFPAALPKGNPEIAYYSVATNYRFPTLGLTGTVDTSLYGEYEKGDLRRVLYFRKLDNSSRVVFRGSYSSIHTNAFFSGLALDELLLIKAECLARTGSGERAIDVLNSLRRARFAKGDYRELTWAGDGDALSKVLQERRKQLLARGLRLGDLKRLNREDRYKKTLTRLLDGERLVLKPGDPRYVFPIPADEIERHGFVQNER